MTKVKTVNKIDRHFRKIYSNNFIWFLPPLPHPMLPFPHILNVIEQCSCLRGLGGGYFTQDTGIELQFN